MRQKIHIMLHGFINVNVIDGSAVFMVGMAKMLSLNPDIKVDLVLATPIHRDILIKELYDVENINIISPFDDQNLIASNPKWYRNKRFTHKEAANVLAYYWNKKEYDWLIVRGMEVVEKLFQVDPTIFKKLMTYVTGITSNKQEFSHEDFEKLSTLFSNSAYLLCQTDEMKEFLENKFVSSLEDTQIITLNPMIPNTTPIFDDVFEDKLKYDKLCYVGKFHHDWNSIPMIVGFREILVDLPETTLAIAGDKFSVHNEYPHYNEDLRYLLENTRNLHWFGALSRDDARSIIINSDIGITWRDENMNDSLELSTKLLEYGSFGKAVLMNRTSMHEEIFGKDYPLYTDSFEEFVKKIKLAIEKPEIYKFAAKRMFEASQNFTFSKTLDKLTPFLYNNGLKNFLTNLGFMIPNEFEQSNFEVASYIQRTNNTNEKYLLSSYKITDGNSILNYLKSCSDLGLIIDTYYQSSVIFTIIKENNQTIGENLLQNTDNSSVKELSDRILKLISFNQQNEETNSNLRLRAKMQFDIDDDTETEEEKSIDARSVAGYKKLERRIRELEKVEKKYNAISKSKLGKLTLLYWKVRNKNKKRS